MLKIDFAKEMEKVSLLFRVSEIDVTISDKEVPFFVREIRCEIVEVSKEKKCSLDRFCFLPL